MRAAILNSDAGHRRLNVKWAAGHLYGRTPRQALEFLARGNEAWRIATSVRSVETHLDLTRLAYAVQVLTAGCAEFHGEPGRQLVTV
ncbi:hypothetical protein G3I59_25035 [Amycolatopsis rubida]|uniref:Uncharacterized protein n=1 Tax=Amycolatopsis rubida TaxID=112413 RepID=A0A1I5VLQ8_9PSEU|nr:hypothetical protein [Amycolatopsis rubida]OAP22974.1 hypothetical protein A4R44_06436 [Amycolatopsis sp. M39]SFQ07916.1 hypothetical protein SAMN05421854_108392 [Amycolatopsis rubida]